MNYISDYLHIFPNRILKNGQTIFMGQTPDSMSLFLKKAYKSLDIKYPKFYKMDGLSKLGFIAAEFLLEKGLREGFADEEIGVVLSNAEATLQTDKKHQERISSKKEMVSPGIFVYTLPNIVIGEICIRFGLKGENAFFITKEFDAKMMTAVINNLFLTDKIKAAVAGWVDEAADGGHAFLYWVFASDKAFQLPEHTAENLKKIDEKPE